MSCRTDGGPQFRWPFNDYCRLQGIQHETSSPYNPQSNGHAEAAIKTAKHLLLRATSPHEFAESLAAWKNTARAAIPSPNEMFLGRRVRDTKAISTAALNFKIPQMMQDDDAEKDKLPPQQSPDSATFAFQPGDNVIVQHPTTKKWDTTMVTAVSHTGHTCKLETNEGYIFRRNRRYLRQRCVASRK